MFKNGVIHIAPYYVEIKKRYTGLHVLPSRSTSTVGHCVEK